MRITGIKNGMQIAWLVVLRRRLADANLYLPLDAKGLSKERHSGVPAFQTFCGSKWKEGTKSDEKILNNVNYGWDIGPLKPWHRLPKLQDRGMVRV